MNIKKKRESNNYYCTWCAQSLARPMENQKNNFPQTRDVLDEEFVFGENGIIHLYPEIRKHLLFIFDDGWDVTYGLHMGRNRDMFGSLEVSEERFPSCKGTPAERLKKLNDMVVAHGWKGTGIWICANGVGEREGRFFSKEERREYWKTRLEWSRDAGIKYWKVDWGHFEKDAEFREFLYYLGKEIAPEIIIEQAGCVFPFSGINRDRNSKEGQSGRFLDWNGEHEHWMRVYSHADAFRTYDVMPSLSIPTTIDRICQMLLLAENYDHVNGLINCEDEAYIGAALGCSIGVMRSALSKPYSIEKSDPQRFNERITEIIRAINWQNEYALPYGPEGSRIYMSDEILFETRNFDDGTMWEPDYANRDIPQGAPAIAARDIKLPVVDCEGVKPYVLASRSPEGNVSVCTCQRLAGKYEYVFPLANIEIDCGDSASAVGVFGYYKKLTLKFDKDISHKRIMIRDLADDTAYDITNAAIIKGNIAVISGEIISEYGCRKNKEGDLSHPGAVLNFIDR